MHSWWFHLGSSDSGGTVPKAGCQFLFGGGAIAYSLLTNYEMGAARLLSMRAHLRLDAASGIGIMAARCAWLFGAQRVIVIDHIEYRLEFARRYAKCEAYNFRSLGDPVLFLKGHGLLWC